ncbi:MAG: VOC family protein [Bdellovibrio sp.]|nr:VOC family protein [Bdellovibrio sp.]
MQTNLDFVSIQVLDMKKSEVFYSEVIGFKKGVTPNSHAVVFETGSGSIFAIRTPLVDLEKIENRGVGISLWFRVPDADVLYEKLLKNEGPIVQPINDGPFGRVFTFKDPNGYAITIHGEK